VARRAARAPAAAQDRAGDRIRRGARALSDPLRVAFVCTGNRFRSPLAAALLAAEAEGLAVEIASLGTLDLGPEPALPEAVAIAEELGLDLSGHRAHSIRAGELRGHDLVVGFERKHVVASVVDGGAAVERTFTLPELTALLGEPGPGASGDAQARIHRAHERRPPDFRNAPLAELRDPLGLSAQEQREIARELETLVERLAAALFD
jgi:low molecular weight protein-tyrosine phosphatase